MSRESLIRLQVGECLHEGYNTVLHEAEATKPEDEESGDGEGTPMSVEILLDGLMEYTVATVLQINLEYANKIELAKYDLS